MTFSSSFCTIFRNCCPGLRLLLTSCPRALSFTCPTKALTTGRATSASRRAIRTSRNVSCMFFSLRLPLPDIFLRLWVRRSLKFSNIAIQVFLTDSSQAYIIAIFSCCTSPRKRNMPHSNYIFCDF